MKLNKSNFALLLMVDESLNYEGTMNVIYNDKVFGKEIEISDTAYINEEKRALTDNEKTLCNQVNKLILKEFSKKGYHLDKWNMYYETNHGSVNIEYIFGETHNNIELSLMENNSISKKVLTLGRTLSRRILKELK
jgi:hypothetical protein